MLLYAAILQAVHDRGTIDCLRILRSIVPIATLGHGNGDRLLRRDVELDIAALAGIVQMRLLPQSRSEPHHLVGVTHPVESFLLGGGWSSQQTDKQ